MSNFSRWTVALVLLALVIVTIAGLVFTSRPGASIPLLKSSHAASTGAQTPLVDQKPLQTARALAVLADGPEEQAFAHQSLKLADYEVDLACADAWRAPPAHPPQMTPELRDLNTRLTQTEAVAKSSQ